MYRYLFVLCFVFDLLYFNVAIAQKKLVLVSGKVLDETGRLIEGVGLSYLENGEVVQLVQTSNKGEFQIRVPLGVKLRFTHVAYDFQEYKLVDEKPITIILKDNSNILKDVVITVGYQKKTKETVTGAVTRITADDIKDMPVANFEQLLQGKVAGLNIQQNTGSPGFRGSVVIRGISQVMVQGSGQEAYLSPQSPLYVIDGIPLDANAGFEYGFQSLGPGTSPLALIPPEDIASIDVMKDAESTALYGSKGANGVIVVTTVKGNSPVPIVRYSTNTFINFVPELRNTIGGKDERSFRVDMIMKSLSYDEMRRISTTQFLGDSLNPFFNNSTNWQSLFYKKTYNHNHNLSISGGDQALNYKTNLNYYSEKGAVKNTGFDRYSLSLNINLNPNSKFQVAGYLSAGLGDKKKGSSNGLSDVGAGSDISSSLFPGPTYFNNVGRFNDLMVRKSDSRTYNTSFFLNALYEILPKVQLSANTSYDYSIDVEDVFSPAAVNSNKSKLYSYNGKKDNIYNRSMISYSNTFNSIHNVYAAVFTEISSSKMRNRVTNMSNGPHDGFYGPLGFNSYYSGQSGVPEDGGISNVNTLGLSANIQYNFQRKYILSLNYREDGNSYSGVNERWAKSPSMGLRWNFDKEKFMEKIDWIDYGSFRYSYGVNLRPTTNIYASMGWYDVAGNYNNVTRISPRRGYMPNPYLKPEKVKQNNFGLEMSFFKNRIAFTFDYYTKNVYDMLYNRSLGTSTGFSSTFTNEASLYNYGYESSVTFRPFSAQSDFNWSISLNMAINRDILLSLPGGAAQAFSNDGTLINRVGHHALSHFTYLSQGVYRTDDDVPTDPVTGLKYRNIDGGYYKAGDMKLNDVNGDYISNPEDRVVAGSPIPEITGGFSSFLTYKGFSLNFNGSILFNREIINNSLKERLSYLRSPFNNGTLVNLNNLNYWTKDGDVAKYPNPFSYYSKVNSFEAQTLYHEDGSYIKMNAITLGYNINKKFLSKYKLGGLRVYTTIANPFVISNYSGPNPEAVDELGRDYLGTYPINCSLSFGLNVEF